MKYDKRKSISDELKNYCYFSNKEDNDFIEVTEWINGEGITVCIETKKETKLIDLTYGQLDAIVHLKNELIHNFNNHYDKNS